MSNEARKPLTFEDGPEGQKLGRIFKSHLVGIITPAEALHLLCELGDLEAKRLAAERAKVKKLREALEHAENELLRLRASVAQMTPVRAALAETAE